ncbi:hypothetical protein K431DRAFT_88126 [Polychaeton citri CBS 116435]|uniref:K Homology domain-containing protein n=1 Tax=Polychaeton citri CBS 116435 TaxID=1314669 RepID=A0A9P4UM46_9PEZI|nr:hypothetical protein K431DRAFT_88126 [Polychaeton citri CBS 116435]
MAEEPRKRSRFDQTEPDPPKRSRFDRRSRSPPRRDSEPRRSRSPIAKSESPAAGDAASAAAAAAARISAQITHRKGIQHVDVPPIRSSATPTQASDGATSPEPGAGNNINKEIYQQDGDYIKDIEVNDLRNRYTLTKGSTQKMIKEETGADVTTRGNYYPDKSLATAANPPLYLHITSTTKDGLEKAVAKVEELMKQDLPNLVDERRFRRRPEQEQKVELDQFGRRKWPDERIPVDLEPIPGFNLRAQVVGAGGSYVKHIQNETRCRVQIKGRGSGFMEHDTGRESDEDMYLHVAGPDPKEVARAKEMCLSLLGSVKEAYEAFKQRRNEDRGSYGRGSYGGQQEDRGGYGGGGPPHRSHSGSHGGNGNAGSSDYYGNNGYGGYGGGAASSTAQASSAAVSNSVAAQFGYTPEQLTYYASFYANNPQSDPYAQYGGFAAVLAYYQSNPGVAAAAAAGQAGSPSAQQNGNSAGYGAPPPPPPEDGSSSAPPPPPPGSAPGPGNASGSSGGYSAVSKHT